MAVPIKNVKDFLSRRLIQYCPSASRKFKAGQTRLSYFLPSWTKADDGWLLNALRSSFVLTQPSYHDAAVVLATPSYVKQIEDGSLLEALAGNLWKPSHARQFHILCAIVDHLPPARKNNRATEGVSILRGHVESMLPDLWDPVPQREQADTDKPSALTFDFGNIDVTLPLARTTFLNGKASTLCISKFDKGNGLRRSEQYPVGKLQRVRIATKDENQFRIWQPLSPLTKPRVVAESFGNIIKRIEKDDTEQPASRELEKAVITRLDERAQQNATQAGETGSEAREALPKPIGVWALVFPPNKERMPTSHLDSLAALQSCSEASARRAGARILEKSFGVGARLFQILSGGGGWGSKEGLLSLDPQVTYFAPSEKEAMLQFAVGMRMSRFAPPGSSVQFFTTDETPPCDPTLTIRSVVFGVPGAIDLRGEDDPGMSAVTNNVSKAQDSSSAGVLVHGHFGALSNSGIFLADHSDAFDQDTNVMNESKLNVPHTRVFLR